MSTSETWIDPLVEQLKKLAAAPADRAALASLRASLQAESAFDGLRLVLPYVRVRANAHPSERTRREDDGLLLAGLFALHPEVGELSLAGALRLVKLKTGSDSIEGRFQALLGASREDLPTHLRHSVSLIASGGIPIDWADLHHALRDWGSDRDSVRRQWARDFWAAADEPIDSDTSPAST